MAAESCGFSWLLCKFGFSWLVGLMVVLVVALLSAVYGSADFYFRLLIVVDSLVVRLRVVLIVFD